MSSDTQTGTSWVVVEIPLSLNEACIWQYILIHFVRRRGGSHDVDIILGAGGSLILCLNEIKDFFGRGGGGANLGKSDY